MFSPLTLSSDAPQQKHHLFSMLGRRSGAFHTPEKEKNNNRRRLALQLSSSLSLPSPPVSLGLTFTHRRIYFLPPVARQQTGKSITWRRQILRKSLQEGDASGRCSMKKGKRRKKQNSRKVFLLVFARRQSKSLHVDLYMQFICCTCPGLSTDCTDKKRMDVHFEVWMVSTWSSLWSL